MGAKLSREQIEDIVETTRKKDQQPDLSQLDLGELDLTGIDLRAVNLSHANLHRAKLYKADLSGSDLSGATLFIANLGWAKLIEADLTEAKLGWADLNGANLTQANLIGADLSGTNLFDANFTGANLNDADLLMANLNDANLSEANLTGAKLTGAMLINTDFSNAQLINCSVYGISAWEIKLEGAQQSNLNISHWNEPVITVDNLEIAQFIYLLLHNSSIHQIIDRIDSKMVLILGSFTPEQRLVMDILKDELHQRAYSPIVFHFDQSNNEGFLDKVSTLAHMSRFVIVDMTNAASILSELQQLIPELSSIPIQPVVARTNYNADLMEPFKQYPWVLDVYTYDNLSNLLAFFTEKVLIPAEIRVKELTKIV